MKHIIRAVLTVFLSSSICGAEDKKLNIVTDDWPPYEFKVGEAGNEYISGFSTEVILAVLKKMNVGINDRIKQYPWIRADKIVREGAADLLYTAANSEEREKETYYAYEPLIDSSWSFFVRKEDEGKIKYDSLEDFKGQKIGVVRGFAYPTEFWDYVKKENSFEEVTTDEFNVKKLIAKRFNIIIIDYINGLNEFRRLGVSDKIVALPKPLKKTSLYAVFSKNTVEKDFVDKFTAELKAFKTTKEYKDIYDKFIGK
jgi:polar amino acid transport system substrate-binding protein